MGLHCSFKYLGVTFCSNNNSDKRYATAHELNWNSRIVEFWTGASQWEHVHRTRSAVRALWTLPLESTSTELEFSSVQFMRCEQGLTICVFASVITDFSNGRIAGASYNETFRLSVLWPSYRRTLEHFVKLSLVKSPNLSLCFRHFVYL